MKKMVAVFMLLFANAAVAQVQVCNLVSLAKQAQFKALGIPVPTAMTEFMTAIELINAQTTALNCEFPPARAIQDLDNAIAWRVTKFARAQGPTYTTMLVEYAASGGKETLSAVVAIKWLKHNNLIEKFNTWDATDVRHNYEALAKQAREKAGADAQQAKAEPPRDQPSQQAITPRIAGAKPQAVTQPEASHPQDAEMSKKANADGLRLLKTSNPDFQAAKRKFEEAVRSDSSNVEALNNLGYVYQRLGDFRTSEAYILKTIQLDPDRRVAYGNLGYVQAKLAKSSEASHNFCEYIKRFNDLERGKATLKRVMSDPDVNVQSAVNEAIARCSLTVLARSSAPGEVGVVTSAPAQDIPAQLRGKWVVKRELPTSTISCWGEPEIKRLIGTEIEYTADSFRWKNHTTDHPTVKVTVVSAEQFHDENSGSGSQVSFSDLGIREAQAKQIKLSYAPANITGGTTEMPGDDILLKDKNTIIFSVCNVYFEAKLIDAPAKAQPQAQPQEKWVAMSNTAVNITGDITISPDKLTMGGIDYPLTLVRTLDAQHLSDVGSRFVEGVDNPTGARLYKTRIPATIKPLRGGATICEKDARWLLTVKGSWAYIKKPELSLVFFESDAEPNLATATESAEFCGTFNYAH